MGFIKSAFADEYSPSLDGQTQGLKICNIGLMEPRGINGKNISLLTEKEAYELADKLNSAGIGISAIGSPLGKAALDDIEEHIRVAENTVRTAVILNCKRIRGFSFFTQPENREKVRDRVYSSLDRLVEMCAARGILFCHENEKGIYGCDTEACIELLDKFKGGMGCVFDPANFIQCGCDAKEAFDALYDRITYMHIKDALPDGTVCAAGEGTGQIPYMLNRFANDGKNVILTLEPHLKVFEGLKELENGTRPKIQNTFSSSHDAFVYAAERLDAILNGIKLKG